MEIGNRKGQSLIESLILFLMISIFFAGLETCHEKIKKQNRHYKIERKTF